MQTLLNLLAGVSLLVWGTHIVRTGILRLYGANLRRVLRKSVNKRFHAFLAGLGVTALIQSSTATALIVAAFAGQGLIGTAPALTLAAVHAVTADGDTPAALTAKGALMTSVRDPGLAPPMKAGSQVLWAGWRRSPAPPTTSGRKEAGRCARPPTPR